MKTTSTLMTMIRGELLRLSDAAGCTLRVQAGRLWVTEEGAGADHIVEPGQAFTVYKGGRPWSAH